MLKASLNLPNQHTFKRMRVPKNKIAEILHKEHGGKAKNKIIDKYLKDMYVFYTLKESNTNIKPFKTDTLFYGEILLIHITLHHENNKIIPLIHDLMGNPIILIVEYNSKQKLSLANKRKSLSDPTKAVVEEIYTTDYITDDDHTFKQAINFNNHKDSPNLYDYYQAIQNQIINHRLGYTTDSQESATPNANKQRLLHIEETEKRIQDLSKQLKQTANYNDRIILINEIKELQKIIKK